MPVDSAQAGLCHISWPLISIQRVPSFRQTRSSLGRPPFSPIQPIRPACTPAISAYAGTSWVTTAPAQKKKRQAPSSKPTDDGCAGPDRNTPSKGALRTSLLRSAPARGFVGAVQRCGALTAAGAPSDEDHRLNEAVSRQGARRIATGVTKCALIQGHLISRGISWASLNPTVAALSFFTGGTLGQPEALARSA